MQEPKQIRDLNELESSFCSKLVLALDEAHKEGLNPLVYETFRSQERQDFLYSKGRRGIPGERKVTWTRSSNHTSRKAADVAPQVMKDGRWIIDWNRVDLFNKLGVIYERFGLTWGGKWKRRDLPHVQDSNL